MPFTPAHAAAAVPLLWLLRSRADLSALVIGSMTPDFAYFLPLGVRRAQSHSLAGLAWFVLPVGLATYVIFHLLVKAPVVALLPLPVASWPAVLVSLVLGAVTHLIWDSFTHAGASGVRAVPILAAPLGAVAGYEILVFKLLQHVSTLTVLGLLGLWLGRWLRATPPPRAPAAAPLPGWARAALIVVVAGALLTGATHGALVGRRPNLPVTGASHMLWGAIIGSGQGLFVALIGLGLAGRLGALRALGYARAAAGDRPT